MKKKMAATLLAAGLSVVASMTAFAGEWKLEDSGKWWWLEDDGSYPVSTWKEIGGKQYYFGEDGYLLTNTTTPDGYFVDESGAWQVVSPAEAEDAYRKYRLYQYGPILDRRDYYVRYCVDDFNGDGVLDMLLTDMAYEWETDYDKECPVKIQLFTIQNGKVQMTDEIQKTSWTGTDDTLFAWFEGQRTIFSYGGDLIEHAYVITPELKFSEIAPDYTFEDGYSPAMKNPYDPSLTTSGNEFLDYVWAQSSREAFIPMYRLSYKWLQVSSLNPFNISGEENSVAD